MRQTKEILSDLENKHSDIVYYYSMVEIIETNREINPDISIESCKSLLEGLSKFILKNLDSNYNISSVDKMDFQPLFKKSLSKISEYNDFMEEDFVVRASSLIHLLGEIRNKRGDISHGKLSPKATISDCLFSNLVIQMTDSIISYVLNCFSKIEIRQELQFDDYPEFNDLLDEENTFGNLKYSKALFDQDIDAYNQELLSYLDLIEN